MEGRLEEIEIWMETQNRWKSSIEELLERVRSEQVLIMGMDTAQEESGEEFGEESGEESQEESPEQG